MFRITFLAVMLAAPSLVLAEISVEDFFRHAKYDEISISPTGAYLAATVPVGDETRLAIIDREKMELAQIFGFGANYHVIDFDWVGDERLIMRTAIKVGWFAAPLNTGDLWAANADGKRKKRLIAGRGFQINSLLPNDEDHILVTVFNASNYPDVMRMDIYEEWPDTDRREMRIPARNGRILADREGVVRVVVGNNPDGEFIVRYREDEDAPWRDVGTFDPREGGLTPIRFHADNQRIYMRGSLEASTEGLVLFDPETGERETLFRSDVVDMDELLVARDRETVFGVRYHPDRSAVHFLDESHPDAQLLTGLRNAFPGQDVRITSFTEDGNLGVVLVASDRNPGEFFLFDEGRGALTPLVKRRPWINPSTMPDREPVTLAARDGLNLRGYLTRPDDQEEGLPLIVLAHGGPHGPRDQWWFDPEAAFFASRGYAVLQVNFRGSGGYGRDFMYSGYRKWGTEMQDDLTDATQWAIQEGIADPHRLCIYGASYGGYAALMGAVREPGLYDCAVGYVGVYDLPLMYDKGDVPETIDGKNYLKRALGEDEQDLIARSPARHVDKIKASLFLVHGEEDIRAHFAHYEYLIKQLDEAGIPYRAMVKAKEGHGFFDEENRFELYRAMWEFFDVHIGPGAQNSQALN